MSVASRKQGPSRKNHYVPEWYQRGFQINGANNWFLNISEALRRPDCKVIPYTPCRQPPGSCFHETDLYVTRFGEHLNDEVETILFQDIDDYGAASVRAFVGGEHEAMHKHYVPLLEYLGAQKLRTPKGLDWIRSRYPALSQVELMVELQYLRHMFGTLWAECAHEIVSAEDSEVKFLVSDHPVTTFNAALSDDAELLRYPHEAPITWNGTHTLFALDADHLLILTHVPYAKEPGSVEPVTRRINARYMRRTLFHTHKLIRTRRFSADDVLTINAWLKVRARRYIAAGQREWLFPERQRPLDRERLALLLQPNSSDTWHLGGEVYIGYKDGSSSFHDLYGRTSREHEIVAKALPTAPPSGDEACPCGRGECYADCCLSLPPWDRPPWDLLSIRERNLRFLNAIGNVLKLSHDGSWQQAQRTLSDKQVADLHRLSSLLWPQSTDLAALLPHPGDGRLRAVYLGPSDPRTAAESIISLVPLFDQILVMDPVLAVRNVAPDVNPVDHPSTYKQQTLKNVMFWLMLEPLIVAGKVLVFRDPCDFSPEFFYLMRDMAKARTADWHVSQQDFEELRWLMKDDVKRLIYRLPDRALASQLRQSTPELSDDQITAAIAYLRQEAELDSLALLQVAREEESIQQYQVIRGANLEVALYVAQTIGAGVVTDVGTHWDHLHKHTRAATGSLVVYPLDITAVLNPIDAQVVAASDAAKSAKASLYDIQSASVAGSNGSDFARCIEDAQAKLKAITPSSVELRHPEYQVDMSLMLSVPPSGFESTTVQRLVVAFGREAAPIKVGWALMRRTKP